MTPEPTTIEVRRRLDELISGSRSSKAALSRMLGKADSYLATFIRRGIPERLEAGERAKLAAFFGVAPRELGEWDNPGPGD